MGLVRSLLIFGMKHEAWVIFFLLPFNVMYRLYRWLLRVPDFLENVPSGEETHRKKTQRVQDQVKKWNLDGRKKKMCTGRAKADSLMLRMPKYRDTLHAIQVDHLKDIVSIDYKRRVVKVEPLVSTAQLSAFLTPLGWTIPIVPELGTLTIGGLVMGGGLETSSHKYGLFHRTCTAFEMVVSSGDAITCSATENPELFKGVPVSYGTIGFLTAVEIEIIEAPRYVRLEYEPVHNLKDAIALIQKHGNDTTRNDFVESLGFAKDKWVVMTGKMMSGAEPGKILHLSSWWNAWFHKHVESHLTSGFGYDYIPIRDYYHRYDRSLGWLLSSQIPYGNHPIFRHLFGWTLPITMQFLKTVIPNEYITKRQFIQDFLVPPEGMEEVILESDELTKLYPVWVCPFKLHPKDGSICTSRTDKTEMYYDIGVYGRPADPKFYCKGVTKKMEAIVLKYKGYQAMYADSYMTEAEVRETLYLSHNEKLRKQYNAEDAFPDMYTKTSVEARVKGVQ